MPYRKALGDQLYRSQADRLKIQILSGTKQRVTGYSRPPPAKVLTRLSPTVVAKRAAVGATSAVADEKAPSREGNLNAKQREGDVVRGKRQRSVKLKNGLKQCVVVPLSTALASLVCVGHQSPSDSSGRYRPTFEHLKITG